MSLRLPNVAGRQRAAAGTMTLWRSQEVKMDGLMIVHRILWRSLQKSLYRVMMSQAKFNVFLVLNNEIN